MQPLLRPWHELDSTDVERSRPRDPQPGRAMPRFDADRVMAEMLTHLRRIQPATDAEALTTLRHAFPAAPLSTRVAAIQARMLDWG